MLQSKISQILKNFDNIPGSPLKVGLSLLGFCVFGYGLLLPWLGIYTDDWTFIWAFESQGAQGLQSYFVTNRPFWGLVYQAVMPVLGHEPVVLHLYGLFWRWFVTFIAWGVLRVIWPNAKRQAFWFSLAFLLYPGFALQYISLCIGNMWLVYATFLASLLLTGIGLRRPSRFWLYNTPALFLSLANILMMEYFLPLEMTRILLIYWILREQEGSPWKTVRRTIYYWLPYALILAIVVFWRMFFFSNQTYYYPLLLVQRFKEAPLDGFLHLIQTVPGDILKAGLGAWARVWEAPLEFAPTGFTFLLYAGVTIVGILASALLLVRRRTEEPGGRKGWAFQAILFGALSMATAGWPFWLTELPVETSYFHSRFTMPFIFGACIFLIGFLELIPWKLFRSSILALGLGGAIGVQLLIANDFSSDWAKNREIVQQIYTRAPMVEPGTMLVFDEFVMRYASTATLTAQLNLLYPPVPEMSVAYGITTSRDVPNWENPDADTPIELFQIFDRFYGNLNKMVLVLFPSTESLAMPPPNCVWFLDRQFIPISAALQKLQLLSDASLLEKPAPDMKEMDPFYFDLFGLDKIDLSGCIAFQKADLALQRGDWPQITAMGDLLQQEESKLLKRMYGSVFIYGYAMNGKWDQAEKISVQMVDKFPAYRGKACAIWELLLDDTPGSELKDSTMLRIKTQVCSGE